MLKDITPSSTSRQSRRLSRTRARRIDPIEQQLDLTHSQALADHMTIDLKPEQATGIPLTARPRSRFARTLNESPTSGIRIINQQTVVGY